MGELIEHATGHVRQRPKRLRARNGKFLPDKEKTHIQTLEELAGKHGVNPGEFIVLRYRELLEEAKTLQAWLAIREGPKPFGYHRVEDLEKRYLVVAYAVLELEKELLPYIHAKKKHVEMQGAGGGPVKVSFVVED
jgi:hypothetical protein